MIMLIHQTENYDLEKLLENYNLEKLTENRSFENLAEKLPSAPSSAGLAESLPKNWRAFRPLREL